MKCTQCGTEFNGDKCYECGTRAPTVATAEITYDGSDENRADPNPLPIKKKNHFIRIFLIYFISIFLIICAIKLFAYVDGKKQIADLKAIVEEQSAKMAEYYSRANEPVQPYPTAKRGKIEAMTVPDGGDDCFVDADWFFTHIGFSEIGIYEQLEHGGFSIKQIEYAVAKCNPDWKEQCLRKSKYYLNGNGFSEKSLREQLNEEGFLDDEIDYAIENCNADWQAECIIKAKKYINDYEYSKTALYKQLISAGFTDSQIEYAFKEVGY